jgi:hypothetical protein
VQAIRDRLAARGGAGIGVALTENNAAIWDTGATRGQNTSALKLDGDLYAARPRGEDPAGGGTAEASG